MNSMTKKDLRIIFMGTPEFAVGILDTLIKANYNVVGVITAADKPDFLVHHDSPSLCVVFSD